MRSVSSDLDRIFKAYDVRGVVPDDLDADLVRDIGAAFAAWSERPEHRRRPRLPAELARARRGDRRGRDLAGRRRRRPRARLDRPAVLRVRLARHARHHAHREPQPEAVQRPEVLPRRRQAGGRGDRVCATSGRSSSRASPPGVARHGSVAARDLLDAYVEHVLSFVDVDAMRPLTIVADTANGMGGLVVPAVMARLPVTLHHLYPELDGTFPNHPADPIDPENQKDLKAAVLEHGADIGLAFDGDADRVFLIDEQAQDVSGSLLTALVAIAMLEREPGAKIVHNLICSWTVPEVIREHGGEAGPHPGRSFVHQAGHGRDRGDLRGRAFRPLLLPRELPSRLGPDRGGRRRSASSRRPTARCRSCWLRCAGTRRRARSTPSSTIQQGRIEAIATRYADGRQDRLDGLTVEFDDWWCNVRPSNTEPLLRLNAEARTPELLAEKTAEVLALIRAGRRVRPTRRQGGSVTLDSATAGDPRVPERPRRARLPRGRAGAGLHARAATATRSATTSP